MLKNSSLFLFSLKILITILCIFILIVSWPQKELDVGFWEISSVGPVSLKEYINSVKKDIYRIRSFGNETIIYNALDRFHNLPVTILNHNGYLSLRFLKYGWAKKRESLFGALPRLFSKHHDRALVLGLGSGVTVSAVSDLYKSVKVFEINSTMKEVVKFLKKQNRNLLEKDNVKIVIQDGFIGTYLEEDGSYDLINHTASDLLYYPASKLYSKEFFKIIKKKLKTNGVFNLWYDSKSTIVEIDTLYNTLLSVFSECEAFLLNSHYHLLICGDRLKMARYKDINTKSEFIKEILSYAPYLKVNARKYFGKNKYSKEINTLNKPTTRHKYHFIPFDDLDPFFQMIIDKLENPNNDRDKVCEILNMLGSYHWYCERTKDEN